MTIQTIAINKQDTDRYRIIVQDTEDITGKDENNVNTYQTYSMYYNPATGKESLKAKIEAHILKRKTKSVAEDTIETDIKAIVESIDVTKIGV